VEHYNHVQSDKHLSKNVHKYQSMVQFRKDTPLIFLVTEYYPTYNNNEYTNNINKLVDYYEQERLPLHVKENCKHIQAPRIDIKVGTIIQINTYRY